LLIGAVIVIGVIALAYWWAGSVVPSLDGRTPVPGLLRPVQVRFDAYAIPHISAVTEEDAWTALGYLQARDRLWQMELYRRAASGRLSELLGESLLPVDKRFLTLGLRRAAEVEWHRSAPEIRQTLERYSAGVNAAIASDGRFRLPLELQLLRPRIDPWTPVDTLAIGKLFVWRLAENHRGELLRYELAQQLGPRAADLVGGMPEGAPRIFSDGPPRAAQPAVSSLDFLLSDEHHGASNSWVLSGSRTASGRPLLANDPHLAIELPSPWWEAHLVAKSDNGNLLLDVAGVTIPGTPSVVIGHNNRIGWGITNSGADVQDFYVEHLDPTRTQFLDHGTWQPLKKIHCDINVKGRGVVPFDVFETNHGPVMNPAGWRDQSPGDPVQPDALEETVLALRWESMREGVTASAFVALDQAGNWNDFLASVRKFSAVSQNFVYADVDGNIGYALSGLLPLRARGDGAFPVVDTNDERETATLPTDQLPAMLNPSGGQVVTANNEIDRAFPHVLTRDWVAPYRAARIVQLLGNRRALDIDAMMQVQSDITSLSADTILKAVGGAAPEELQHWDRRVDDSPAAAFYEVFEEALWKRTFADEMPAPLFDRFYRYAANERIAGLQSIITDRDSPWFDDRHTPAVRETRDDMVRLAARDARVALNEHFGNRSSWRWGQMHTLKFSHPLGGGGRVLDWFFSRGPFPLDGDGMTVNKTTTNLRRPYEISDAASYRQILDVGDWDRSVAVNTAGQSGHAASPHYFDQNSLWRVGRYHPMPFTDRAVDAATAWRLELVPINGQ